MHILLSLQIFTQKFLIISVCMYVFFGKFVYFIRRWSKLLERTRRFLSIPNKYWFTIIALLQRLYHIWKYCPMQRLVLLCAKGTSEITKLEMFSWSVISDVKKVFVTRKLLYKHDIGEHMLKYQEGIRSHFYQVVLMKILRMSVTYWFSYAF